MQTTAADILRRLSAASASRKNARARWRGRPELRLDHAIRQGRAANNFDLLRLVAAGLVMFAHSFALTGSREPLPSFMHEDWGEIGVVMFFSISGFLIASSWAYDPKPLSFAVKRALRLMPALIVSLLLTALVLGPLVTTVPLDAYLEDPGTKAFVLSNATFQSAYTLPGVFATTHYPLAVNGSLWTLPLELKAYCLVLVLGLLGLFGRRRLLMPLVGIFVALLTVNSIRVAIPGADHLVAMLVNVQMPPALVAQAHAGAFQEYVRLFAAFAIGASLFALARWVPLRWSIAIALAVAWTAVTLTVGESISAAMAAWVLPYVVLLLAYRSTHLVRLPARLGDYSYGLYIFAFPVQQAISQWLAPTSGWAMFAIATPIVLALAVASWHFVEAPALTLKQRIRQPLEQAAAEATHPLEREALQPEGLGAPSLPAQEPVMIAQPLGGLDVDTGERVSSDIR
jgi:peptidoglycan/LPS O-acetylase OafA/YrhL